MSSHEQFEELIPLYALGALSPDEARELRAHLRECDECRARYRQERATARLLLNSAEPVEPSPDTRRKLFERVDADLAARAARIPARPAVPAPTMRPLAPAGARPWYLQPAFAFAALALVAIVAVGLWLVSQNARSPEQQEIAQILSNPNRSQHALKGTEQMPNGFGTLHTVPGEARAVLVVGALQPLPADKTYEFWLIRGAQPLPAGLFTVDSQGQGQLLVKTGEDIAAFDKWAVSVEPRQGVTQPSGPIVLAGGF